MLIFSIKPVRMQVFNATKWESTISYNRYLYLSTIVCYSNKIWEAKIKNCTLT
jgi:hypothetical protein